MDHRRHNQWQRQDRAENRSHVANEVCRMSEQASGVIQAVKAALSYT